MYTVITIETGFLHQQQLKKKKNQSTNNNSSTKPLEPKLKESSPTLSIKNSNYIGIVELLPNIQCYHVFLKKENKQQQQQQKHPSNNEQLEITTLNQLKLFIDYENYNNNNRNHNTWTHIRLDLLLSNYDSTNEFLDDYQSNCLMELKLPSIIPKNDVRISIEDGNHICLRLPYNDNTSSPNFATTKLDDDLPVKLQTSPQTNLIDINHVRCKFCHQYLLHPHLPPNQIPIGNQIDAKIHKIFPLPTGHWDDILDYLTCYEGVSTVHAIIHLNTFIQNVYPNKNTR